MSNKKSSLFPLLIIITIAIGLYLSTLKNGFVYDDESTIVNNTFIKSYDNLPLLFDKTAYFRGSGEISYRPVVTFTYFIDYSIYGLKPWGYHLTNVFLHAVNGILLYIFLNLFITPYSSCRTSPAFIISLLFLTHPVLTETVNCISYREDLLAFMFFMTTISLYLRVKKTEVSGRRPLDRVFLYLLSCLAYILALLSKEMAVTVPLIIYCYEWFYSDKKEFGLRTLLLNGLNVGYVLITVGYIYLRFYLFQNPIEANLPHWGINTRIATVPLLLVNYLKLSIFPISLSADYIIPPITFIASIVFLKTFIFVFIFFTTIYNVRETNKTLAFGLLFFCIILIPIYNIIPITNPFAERYLYLPMAGLVITLGAIIDALFKLRSGKFKHIFLILCAVIIGLFCLITLNRNRAWRDNFTIWSDTIKKQPNSAMAHYNLGFCYLSKEKLDEAMLHFQAAIRVNKYHSDAHNSLGVIYLKKKQFDKAKEEFTEAIGWHPNEALYYKNLGRAYVGLGQPVDAIREFQAALVINPDYVDAHYNIGRVYLEMGFKDKALLEFERVLKLKPDHAETRQILKGIKVALPL